MGGVEQAHREGARLEQACLCAGIDVRTLQRWRKSDGLLAGDKRPSSRHPKPPHALSSQERQEIVHVVNQSRFADLPASQIVPRLADEGIYIASESSFRRVLKDVGQAVRRGLASLSKPGRLPTTHTALAPGQVWCWDITWLPSLVIGRWFYLYVIMDLFSRKIVYHEVHDIESSDIAARVVKMAAVLERVDEREIKPVLHGDNGSSLKSMTVWAMLHHLGIARSYSRPRVSNDNAFIESLFRTAKYRPGFPAKGFANLAQARKWSSEFVGWYNTEHRHSGVRFVTPEQKHCGMDRDVLMARREVYEQARRRNPARWSGQLRNWDPIERVQLNPDRVERAIRGQAA